MFKKIIVGAFLAVASISAALAGGAQARVINVVERVEQVNYPRQECRTDYVQERQPRGMTGTVIGGIAGGIIGNQVGKGNGQVVATALGAVTGAFVGDHVENRDNGYTQRPIQNCYQVNQWQPRTVGYDVTYEFNGRRYSTFMNHRPGRFIMVDVNVTPYGGYGY